MVDQTKHGAPQLIAGADGILVEVHPEPEKALSDGRQALTFEMFAELMTELRMIAPVVRRERRVVQ